MAEILRLVYFQFDHILHGNSFNIAPQKSTGSFYILSSLFLVGVVKFLYIYILKVRALTAGNAKLE